MKFFFWIFLAFTFVNTSAQDLEVYESFDSYAAAVTPDPNKVYVVNYWATWCAPCVKELPHFERLGSDYKDQNVEVVLVSLDFKNQQERALIPFIERKGLKSRVIHLTDPKTNDWIDRVDPSWSGALPATVFSKGNKKHFIEGDVSSFEELEEHLKSFVKD